MVVSWPCGKYSNNFSILVLNMSFVVCAEHPGQWVFRTSKSQFELNSWSPDFQCYQWYSQQKQHYNSLWWLSWYVNSVLPTCPCVLSQALWDPRFYVDLNTACAVSSFPINFNSFSLTQACMIFQMCSWFTLLSIDEFQIIMPTRSWRRIVDVNKISKLSAVI